MVRPGILFVIVSICLCVSACASNEPRGSDRAFETVGSPAPQADRSAAPILATTYSHLYVAGGEKPGYGLYSYALFPAHSRRADAFFAELFRTTGAAAESGISPANLNVVHVPTRDDKRSVVSRITAAGRPLSPSEFSRDFYDYALARQVLAQICTVPSDAIAYLCRSDLSRGPYLFTFNRSASDLSPVPPPYLFVDLSRVHPRAFSEFIAAYKEQVKRTDYSDRERIDHLRLHVLNIILTAADWVGPVRGAVADTVYMSTASE